MTCACDVLPCPGCGADVEADPDHGTPPLCTTCERGDGIRTRRQRAVSARLQHPPIAGAPRRRLPEALRLFGF